MIKFLFKGILRDKSRSRLPIIVIAIGVMLTIVLSGFLKGMMSDLADQNARFSTGHVKIMTKAYAKNQDQLPIDLALLGVETLTQSLHKQFPDMQWVDRIEFGGLIDVPDKQGNSKGQGPVAGMAINLFSKNSGEIERLNLNKAVVTGKIPDMQGKVLVGNDFAQKMHLSPGDTITYMGSTMYGSMSFKNFVISGTVHFGVTAMDKGAMIIDLSDAQDMLNMDNGAGEILGYLKSGVYYDAKAQQVKNKFNAEYAKSKDEFAPVMFTLKEQNNLGGYLDYADQISALFVFIFVLAMSIVLWNTGLLGGFRRYQEYGIRLALGASKWHIYSTMVYEAVLIGIVGTLLGMLIGLGFTYLLQIYGIDISSFLSNASMIMPSKIKARVTPELFYIGFIPGLLAMVLGNMLSGLGIYKRQTATLFKELEV